MRIMHSENREWSSYGHNSLEDRVYVLRDANAMYVVTTDSVTKIEVKRDARMIIPVIS